MSVRRIMFALAVAVSGAGAASADEADQGIVCATALSAPVDQMPAVIAACSKIQRKQPTPADQARVWRYLGIALFRSGDIAGAVINFDKTLRLTPDDHWALQRRAEANERLGHRQLAIPDYQRLAVLQPGTRWRMKLAELGTVSPAEQLQLQDGPQSPPGAPPVSGAPASLTRSGPTELVQGDPVVAAPGPPVVPDPPTAPVQAPPPQGPSELVTKLQTALRALGYPVSITGRAGGQLRQGIDAFARDVGLPIGSEPSEELLAEAQAELTSRRQQQAEADRRVAEEKAEQQRQAAEEQMALVRRAQSSLADLGYEIGDIDGVIGSRTRKALSDMANRLGLPPPRQVDLALVEKLETAVVDQPTNVAAVDTRASTAPPTGPDAGVQVARPPSPPPPPPDTTTVVGKPPQAVQPPETIAGVSPLPPPMSPQSTVPVTPPSSSVNAQTGEVCTHVATASQEKRVALVIGNADYEHVTKLNNPRADAEDMSKALCEIGFDVVEGYDLDRGAMDDKTIEFASRAETADLAFVYYSGHGIQVDGVNYLVPTDAQFEDRRDLRRLVRLDQLTEDTGAAKKAILVVDACRNDPSQATSLTRAIGLNSTRSPIATGAGLAQPFLRPGSKTLVAFATRPGTVAYDGKPGDRNSPYVEALLRRIKTPGIEVTRVFGMVQDDVSKETGNAQEPTYTASLGGEEVFLVATPPKPAGLALDDLTPGERRAIQNSLKLLGYWSAPVDGQMSELLLGVVKSVQRIRGDDDTGLLTPSQAVALHRQADYARPPEPLPPLNLDDAIDRAVSGDPAGQRELGMAADPMFAAVVGRSKDRARAISLYQKAAVQGDRMAMTRLGMLLATSMSTDDQAAARKLLGQAAEAGDPVAALRLAELLLDGPNAANSKDKAIDLLKIASASPDTDGIAAARQRMLGVPVGP